METFTFNTVELILLSAAGILFIIQLIYYFGLYNRIHISNKAVRKEEVHFTQEMPPLSVILYARNEADNLRKILPSILEQDYPQFEVIVINELRTAGACNDKIFFRCLCPERERRAFQIVQSP